MYICDYCKRVTPSGESAYDLVPYGSSDVPMYVGQACPSCGCSLKEAYKCKGCGEYFVADDLHSFYCEDCIKEEFDKSAELWEFGKEVITPSGINDYALEVFGGIDGINSLLKSLLIQVDNIDINFLKNKKEKYIKECIEELGEWLEAQNENS